MVRNKLKRILKWSRIAARSSRVMVSDSLECSYSLTARRPGANVGLATLVPDVEVGEMPVVEPPTHTISDVEVALAICTEPNGQASVTARQREAPPCGWKLSLPHGLPMTCYLADTI